MSVKSLAQVDLTATGERALGILDTCPRAQQVVMVVVLTAFPSVRIND